jgi:hypothetical protein
MFDEIPHFHNFGEKKNTNIKLKNREQTIFWTKQDIKMNLDRKSNKEK